MPLAGWANNTLESSQEIENKTGLLSTHPGFYHHSTNSLTPESSRDREKNSKIQSARHQEKGKASQPLRLCATQLLSRGTRSFLRLPSTTGISRPSYLLRDPGMGRAAMPGTDFGSPRVWSWQAPDACRGPRPTPEGYQPPSHTGQSGARASLVITKDLLAPVDSSFLPCLSLHGPH